MRSFNLIFLRLLSEIWPVFGEKNPKNGKLEKLMRHYYHGPPIPNHFKLHLREIEKLRKSLLKSEDKIEVKEYGEGHGKKRRRPNKFEYVKDVCRNSSKSKNGCEFLYRVIGFHKSEKILELGTCLGISTAYLSRSICNNVEDGKVISLEGSDGRAEIARRNMELLSLDIRTQIITGKFEETLDAVLGDHGKFSMAFIDGHHNEEATVQYFNRIVPEMDRGGLMIFDDIFWSEGMFRAWKYIQNHEDVRESVSFMGMGILVVSHKL